MSTLLQHMGETGALSGSGDVLAQPSRTHTWSVVPVVPALPALAAGPGS